MMEGTNTAAAPTSVRGLARALVIYIEMAKPRSVLLLSYCALVGGLLAAGPSGAWSPALLLSMGAVILGSMGANSVTGYIDRDIDAVMARTDHRPLPTGRLVPSHALAYGLGLCLGGLILLAAGGLWTAVGWYVFGLADNILIYSLWLKRRSPWSVLAGAPSGGAPVMVTSAAVSGSWCFPPAAWLSLVVVVWTPLHIWSLALKYREDYARAEVRSLPVVKGRTVGARYVGLSAIVMVGVGELLAYSLGITGVLRIVHLALQAAVLIPGMLLALRPDERMAWFAFKVSSPYLALISALLLVG